MSSSWRLTFLEREQVFIYCDFFDFLIFKKNCELHSDNYVDNIGRCPAKVNGFRTRTIMFLIIYLPWFLFLFKSTFICHERKGKRNLTMNSPLETFRKGLYRPASKDECRRRALWHNNQWIPVGVADTAEFILFSYCRRIDNPTEPIRTSLRPL